MTFFISFSLPFWTVLKGWEHAICNIKIFLLRKLDQKYMGSQVNLCTTLLLHVTSHEDIMTSQHPLRAGWYRELGFTGGILHCVRLPAGTVESTSGQIISIVGAVIFCSLAVLFSLCVNHMKKIFFGFPWCQITSYQNRWMLARAVHVYTTVFSEAISFF